jgi:hypothetical protein
MVSKNLHKGKRCFIVGTGASITDIDMSLLKNEITISFNNILLKDDFTPTYLCVADTTVMEKNYDIIFNDRMKNGHYVICNGCKISEKYPNGHGNCTLERGSTCRGIKLDPKFTNVYTVKHDEKSGIHIDHIDWPHKTKLLKPDQYYIDSDFETITCYGGGTVDNLCIPLAVYLGFEEIYLIGCDALWGHFYDNDNRKGRREWINFKHVLDIIEPMGIKLIDIDPAQAFEELEWRDYKTVL